MFVPRLARSYSVPVAAALAATWTVIGVCAAAGAGEPPGYRVELGRAGQGFDGKTCWVHARVGAIPPRAPGNPHDRPMLVLTMQKLLLSGSDVFYALHTQRSGDLGRTWTEPTAQPTLARHTNPDGTETAICDFTPKWHAATGKLLGTGQTVWYKDNRVMHVRPRHTGYSVYDPQQDRWSQYELLEMPREARFANAGGGSAQRYDLPGGDVLLPIYFKEPAERQYSVTVVRCRFDGQRLTYVEHGDEMTIPVARGFFEPSLTSFQGRFYLTIRNDAHGYVTSGSDGLHFDEPKKWTFDDGAELGNYNTQQHWVTHSDGLFLAYTRRGADNDHVFRHRAPLFIGRVDPKRLCVIRSTERVLVPERGARLGNFGVVDVSPQESWVTVTEWMQPRGCEKHGSDNSIWLVKIKWARPNRLVPAR